MKKVMLVFGTRPEAIKMAPLILELKRNKQFFETIVCVSGQHREMLDQVLSIFEIIPDFDLNIMQKNQDLYDVSAKLLIGMRSVFQECKPDIVLVHGDTSTSTIAALSAFYSQIPVGHVEAGLRTNNIYSPWPEEVNRQITSRISTYNFAPTILSKENLLKENVVENTIVITGNTVIDALNIVLKKIESSENEKKLINNIISNSGYDLSRLDNNERRLVLITGHRRENFGQGFEEICKAIKDLSINYPGVDFVYPMHLNPNVRKPIYELFGNINNSNAFFIEPLEYLPFVWLMEKSYFILTDSGGIQEEAPSLGKPVLVMRDTTERPEALSAGTVKLVGTNKEKIIFESSRLLDDKSYYETMSKSINPYGDGFASDRIVTHLINNL